MRQPRLTGRQPPRSQTIWPDAWGLDTRTSGAGRGIDYIRVSVKDSAETIRRILRERGIAMADGSAPGSVRIADPDGIGIELAPA